MLNYELWFDKARNRYTLCFTEKKNGKKRRRRISTRTDNKQQAKLFRAEYIENQESKTPPCSVETALREAYRSKREQLNLRPSTCREYERTIRLFTNFTNQYQQDLPIQAVDFSICDAYLSSIRSLHQRIKHRANLLALWNVLKDFRKYSITENHFERIKKPRLPQTDPEQLTEEEFERWCEYEPDYFNEKMWKLCCELSYRTGLRLSEIPALRVKHTVKEDLQVRNYPDHIIKNKQNRDIPITDRVREILKEAFALKIQHRLERVRESEFVFCNNNGYKLSGRSVTGFFLTVRRLTLPESKATFHALRRSFGQNLLNNGIGIADVSRLLGHSSIAVTEKHYAAASKMSNDRIRKKMNESQLVRS